MYRPTDKRGSQGFKEDPKILKLLYSHQNQKNPESSRTHTSKGLYSLCTVGASFHPRIYFEIAVDDIRANSKHAPRVRKSSYNSPTSFFGRARRMQLVRGTQTILKVLVQDRQRRKRNATHMQNTPSLVRTVDFGILG